MATIASLEARYGANIIDFEKELKRLQSINKRATDRVLNDHKSAARATNQAWAKADIGGAVNRSLGSGLGQLRGQLMASIAAITSGAGVAAAVGLADTYNRFTNSLKVAGVEGANLAVVQDRLFASANRNGVAIESLGQLYGRVSQSAKELGVSQEQVLRVTDAVSAAIRVSGQPISAASGAMLQMSQALGAGTVRAEEFNSMMEGMLPLVQAAAGASAKYGGSVAKMRTDVLAGKLTSKEFFDLILAGSASLEAKAARAPLTVAQSFQQLKNKMVEAIGKTNETWGVTDRLTEALMWLGNNLDDVGNALGVIAIALAAALAPALGKAAISMTALSLATARNAIASVASIPGVIGLTAGISGITPAAATARMALMALTSATGIGLAITAITVAVGAFALQSYKAAEASRQLRDRVKEKAAALDEAEKAAANARVETGNMTSEEYKALEATAKLTGRVDLLTSAYGRMALAAWEAARAAAAAALESAATDRKKASADRQRIEAGATRQARGPGSYGTADGRQPNPMGFDNMVRGAVATDPRVLEARATERNAMRIEEAERANAARVYREGINGQVERYGPARTTPTGSGPRTGRGNSGGSTGPSAEDIANNEAAALATANRALRDATRAQAVTASARHAVAIEALEDDKAMAVLAIEKRVKDREIGRVTADQLVSIQAQTTSAQIAAETARRAEELAEAQRELQSLRNNNAVEAARLDADELTEKARNTTNMAERHAYEVQALEATQRADRLMFDAEQAAYALQLKKNEIDQAEIDRLVAAREANFARGQAGATGSLTNTQDRENGPSTINEWANAFRDATNEGETFNQKMFGIAEGGIDALTSGLTDALMGAKSLGEAFADMAKQIIGQLVKLMVQWAIWEGIGLATGNGPGWGLKVLGFGQGKSGGSAPSHAMGTNFAPGGPSWVSDTELINLPNGSQVIPASVVRQAMAVKSRPSSGGQTIVNEIHVNAQDAVLTQQVKQWVWEGVNQGMSATRAMVRQDQGRAQANRLGR